LILPYLIFVGIALAITLLISGFQWRMFLEDLKIDLLIGYKLGHRTMTFMPVLWFIPTLALAKCWTSNALLYNYGYLLIILFAIFSMLMTRYGITLPFGVSQAAVSALFLYIGYGLRVKNIFDRISDNIYLPLFY